MNKDTLAKAKEFLDYDPTTGMFVWKRSNNRKIVVGAEAGWLHNFGYIVITLCNKKIYAHRLAWAFVNGAFDKNIDHINGDPKDNRINNLRVCTQSQNIMNYKCNSRNTSGVRGVTFDKSRNKWAIRLKSGDKRVQKRFDSFEDAVAFSNKTRIELFGDFAYERRPQ